MNKLCVMIVLFYAVFEAIFGNVIQLHPVLSVDEGKTVILPCFIKKNQVSVASWYKQGTGEEPRLIITTLLKTDKQFHGGFDRNHFNLLRGTDSFNLTIVDTLQSDSATYFCATSFSNIITFGNGTRLIIKGSEIINPNHLQQPKFELVDLEGNTPLKCSIQTQLMRDGGEHRLYWFSHGSEESSAGSVYVHSNTSDSCVGSSEPDCLSPSCVYNLPKKSFRPSDAGLYHCALATCGEALFANISKGNHNVDGRQNILFFQIGLAALLALSLTINVLLYCLRKKRAQKQQMQTTDEDNIDDAPINQNTELTYATVKTFTKPSSVNRPRDQEDTLYAGLACHQQS